MAPQSGKTKQLSTRGKAKQAGAGNPVTDAEFAAMMALLLPFVIVDTAKDPGSRPSSPVWAPPRRVRDDGDVPSGLAVAVSGGADSMALLYLLGRWSSACQGPRIHALTVDHGLRPESKHEARQVAAWVAGMNKAAEGPGSRPKGLARDDRRQPDSGFRRNDDFITHHILTWRGVKPKTKISETARAKRYELLGDYCQKNKINHLFLAHHLDDQAETILMRLAAGSGVDGLAGMRAVDVLSSDLSSPRKRGSMKAQSDCLMLDPRFRGDNKERGGGDGKKAGKNILILRPLLSVSHDRLCATLRAAGQDWIEDPTNKNQNYARPRLRGARDVLAAEGLTPSRLSALARRMARARAALERFTDAFWNKNVGTQKDGYVIARGAFESAPSEIQVRVLARALPGARLEQVEDLVARMTGRRVRATLAGFILSLGEKKIRLSREKSRKTH